MIRADPPGRLKHMTKRRLTLELEVTGTDSISGRLIDLSGLGTDFVGWIGLAGAIESQLSGSDPPAEGPDITVLPTDLPNTPTSSVGGNNE